jgi:glycerol uptake facilitator-like aquaporin
MDRRLFRLYLIELVATFGLVFFSAGAVCVNHLTTPTDQQPATATQTPYQPGLVGIAMAQGLILTALLGATVRVSGGYLNPAIAMMLWLFNRLDTRRFAWLVGAQFVGAVLAGMCIHYVFEAEVARQAQFPRFGTPHVSPEAYGPVLSRGNLLAGTGIEVVLTFFLVFAIFTAQSLAPAVRAEGSGGAGVTGFLSGLVMTACVLVAFPLTGAAVNPARWFGCMVWEWAQMGTIFGRPPYADLFVYVAGPIVGAMLAGIFYFKIYSAALAEPATPETTVAAAPAARSKGAKDEGKKK